MNEHAFPEDELRAALTRSGPLDESEFTVLAHELGLEFTDKSQACFRMTLQWTVTQFAVDSVREASEPRDHMRDVLDYLRAQPHDLPELISGQLGKSPRFQNNVAIPAVQHHLLSEAPARVDPASMIRWVDWTRARLGKMDSEFPRRRGKPESNIPLRGLIQSTGRARLPKHLAQRLPAHSCADQPETQPFFRYVDKAVGFGCLAAQNALQQIGGINGAARDKVLKNLERMLKLKSRGLQR